MRRELQEELLHRVLQDRRPSRGPDLRRAPRQGLRRPRAGGVQVLSSAGGENTGEQICFRASSIGHSAQRVIAYFCRKAFYGSPPCSFRCFKLLQQSKVMSRCHRSVLLTTLSHHFSLELFSALIISHQNTFYSSGMMLSLLLILLSIFFVWFLLVRHFGQQKMENWRC